ncbi:hypothetical protein IGI37_001521 [Enterococcus sp. AZ194]|uniref:hypothetical protein n=1 Tax=Enterococcus sp. AZ194 TaxID=2774629 RepID=UPI003F25CED2
MKKIVFVLTIIGLSLSLTACGASGDKEAQSTESSLAEVNEKMKKGLDEQGVEIKYTDSTGYVIMTREKSIDYDYFEMLFDLKNNEMTLELKGNIDGKMKPPLYYKVSKGRLVEDNDSNTDIRKLAEVLESLDYSDKEMLEFAQWYQSNNK